VQVQRQMLNQKLKRLLKEIKNNADTYSERNLCR
jgi:hypothetical protein